MEKNIDNNSNFVDDSLFNDIFLTENIVVPPDKFNHKLNSYLEENLKSKIEEKCIDEGYVKKDSISIVKKSIGSIKGSQFNGYISYLLLYKASICNPKSGGVIKCKVKLINNKLGLLCNSGPLTIIVGKQLHNNPELLEDINTDDIIEVKIIESKFSMNDKEIRILGKLNSDSDNVKKNLDVDDLNDIDAEDINDNESNLDNNDINDLDLESLDDLSSDEEDDEEDEDEDIENDDDLEDMDDLEDIEEVDDVGEEVDEVVDEEVDEEVDDEADDDYS